MRVLKPENYKPLKQYTQDILKTIVKSILPDAHIKEMWGAKTEQHEYGVEVEGVFNNTPYIARIIVILRNWKFYSLGEFDITPDIPELEKYLTSFVKIKRRRAQENKKQKQVKILYRTINELTQEELQKRLLLLAHNITFDVIKVIETDILGNHLYEVVVLTKDGDDLYLYLEVVKINLTSKSYKWEISIHNYDTIFCDFEKVNNEADIPNILAKLKSRKRERLIQTFTEEGI